VKAYGAPFTPEVSYINGGLADYRGQPGSSRIDVVVGPLLRPSFVVDLKTGGGFMSQGTADRYYAAFPKGTLMYTLHITP
jgi:hypothetical protein